MTRRPLGTSLPGDIYRTEFVRALFDEMSETYERVNIVSSFGFSAIWRRQAVAALRLRPGDMVVDWMTGMGEAWRPILCRIGAQGRLTAVDLSPGMARGATARRTRWPRHDIDLVVGDALQTDQADASADAVLVSFGLKTLSIDQTDRLAAEIARVLRPGGRFSLIEVSLPDARILRWPYRFYLNRIIPLIGRMLLGDPETYRMLGVYTERFGDSRRLVGPLRTAGLEACYVRYFFGCASGVVGRRPEDR